VREQLLAGHDLPQGHAKRVDISSLIERLVLHDLFVLKPNRKASVSNIWKFVWKEKGSYYLRSTGEGSSLGFRANCLLSLGLDHAQTKIGHLGRVGHVCNLVLKSEKEQITVSKPADVWATSNESYHQVLQFEIAT
jgi:hypothetical protein